MTLQNENEGLYEALIDENRSLQRMNLMVERSLHLEIKKNEFYEKLFYTVPHDGVEPPRPGPATSRSDKLARALALLQNEHRQEASSAQPASDPPSE